MRNLGPRLFNRESMRSRRLFSRKSVRSSRLFSHHVRDRSGRRAGKGTRSRRVLNRESMRGPSL